MSKIQDYIKKIPKDRIAISSHHKVYSYNDILSLINFNLNEINDLIGSVISINSRSREEFALLLIMLDGVANKILFLPSDIDSSLHAEYYRKVNVEYEIYIENNKLHKKVVNTNIVSNEFFSKTNWIIPTSGTTAVPKLVSHTFETLTKSSKIDITIGGDFNWGLVFDIYRFSGIQVFLQSILSGSNLIVTESVHNMNDIVNLFILNKCNALSATPSFWRKLLMNSDSTLLKLKRITLGGEISDDNILKALAGKFPEAKVSHIYASTEVGVGFSVTDGREGFPKSYLDGELQNIKMKIDEENLLWIAPRNKDQFYISQTNICDDKGYINTGDLVKLEDDRVYFLGRDSGSINVGGNKVLPEEVELKLISTGLVQSAHVYSIKNSMMGALVCADVVLKDQALDKKEAKSNILHYCREHLENFKVPAILKFVDELKITQSGKLKREIK